MSLDHVSSSGAPDDDTTDELRGIASTTTPQDTGERTVPEPRGLAAHDATAQDAGLAPAATSSG